MLDILSWLFTESGHMERSFTEGKLFAANGKKNFWVVITHEPPLLPILENQVPLFVAAKQAADDPAFDKNAYLLVLCRVESTAAIDQDGILALEGDSYHFKKCVIYYTLTEYQQLRTQLQSGTALATLQDLLFQAEIFAQHKEAFNRNPYQSLVYRMAHMLPFVQLNISKTNNLSSLEEINKDRISERPLDQLLHDQLFTLPQERFNSFTGADLFQILKPILRDEA